MLSVSETLTLTINPRLEDFSNLLVVGFGVFLFFETGFFPKEPKGAHCKEISVILQLWFDGYLEHFKEGKHCSILCVSRHFLMPNLAKVSSTVEASSIETISDLSLLSILWESEQAVLEHWRDWLITAYLVFFNF